MAYALYRRGPWWYFDFQVAGKRYRKTTREISRRKAAMVASEAFEAAILEARDREPTPTLRRLVQMWLRAHRATVSVSHRRNIETFGRLHLYGLAGMQINRIWTEDVEEGLTRHLRDHSRSTGNQWLRNLRLLTGWAVRRGLLAKSNWSVRTMKVQKKTRTILPVAKAGEWLGAVKEAAGDRTEIWMVVMLILGLGLRISEAISARWEWVDWERSTYTPGRTKGREAEPVPIPAWLRGEMFDASLVRGLIAKRSGGVPVDPRSIRAVMQQANEKCGIHGLTPHRLRGTYATLLSAIGVPLQEIQSVMRHKQMATTFGYLERNPGRVKEAVDSIGEKMQLGGSKTAQHAIPDRMDTGFADYRK